MKTFFQFLELTEQLKGVKTPELLAKKHNVSIDLILNQLKKGIKVEKEHTKNKNIARTIALQHLDEIPDYYDRLSKVEKKNIKEGTLHHWYKGSKSIGGKPGWVKPDGSPCANEPGETKTPKCFSSGRLKALKRKGKKGLSIIRSAVRRKRQKDKNQQEKTGAAKPTYVSTFSKGKKDKNYVKAEPTLKEATKDIPGKGSGTKDACYYKVKSRYRVWPSAYASGALVKCRRVGASNWGTQKEDYTFIQKRGTTYTIILTWKGKPITTQMFFPHFKRPTRNEVLGQIEKVYPGARLLTFAPSIKDPTKPLLFSGE